jgi:hypothetical protein
MSKKISKVEILRAIREKNAENLAKKKKKRKTS